MLKRLLQFLKVMKIQIIKILKSFFDAIIGELEANILYKFYEWPNRHASKRKAYQYMFEAIWKF